MDVMEPVGARDDDAIHIPIDNGLLRRIILPQHNSLLNLCFNSLTLRCTEAQLVQTKTPCVTHAHPLPGSLNGASQSAQERLAGSRSSRSSSRGACRLVE